MDCFEIDFTTRRASAYEIQPEAPDQLGQILSLYWDGYVEDALKDSEAAEYGELKARIKLGFADTREMARLYELSLAALAKLPEEDRNAVSYAVVPIGGPRESTRPTARQ